MIQSPGRTRRSIELTPEREVEEPNPGRVSSYILREQLGRRGLPPHPGEETRMAIDPSRLRGQVALITGASSGLGRASASAFVDAGADVALVARSERDLEQIARKLEPMGRHVLTLPTDLADEEQISRAIQRALDTLGHIDVLVNAAGTDVPRPVVDLASPDWDRVLSVNLRAPFLLAKALFPSMAQHGKGTIINVSSVAGKRGWANAAAYCASKFGLTGLTQALAAEGKAHGIRVCVVYPGAMATNWGTWSGEERYEAPAGMSGPDIALPPEDVAALLVWISSAPRELVLNEVIATPLHERGWP